MPRVDLVDRIACPLCGSLSSTVHIDFPQIPVHRCSCGFIFSAKLLPDIERYYRDDFGSLRHMQGQIVNATINAWVLQRLLKGRPPRSVLDVGAGYGFFLLQVREGFGAEATGVELSKQEALYGAETLAVDLRNQLLSEAGLPRNHYDLVTAFEVIEHIADPRPFIAELAEYVKPGGHLLVMTDNFESGIVRSLGPGFPKWIPHAHVSHFGPQTFERVMSESGLQVAARLSYTPWELYLRRLYYALRGIRKSAAEFDLEAVLRSEMGGTFKLFRLRRLLNKTWVRLQAKPDLSGAQMYLLARKPE